MLTEDGLQIILQRLERMAAAEARASDEAAHRKRVGSFLEKTQQEVQQLRKDMRDAEKKIGEWAEYAGQLRSAIDAVAPRAVRSKKIVLPKMPDPLVTDIPF